MTLHFSHKSGVYLIENTVNGKCYVGSSVNLRLRKNEHFNDLRNGSHHNVVLLRAYKKYGVDALKFKVLLFCSRSDTIWYEQRAIDTIKPEYNICEVAGSSLGRKLTEGGKQKLREHWLGRIFSEEHRAKISASKRNPSAQHREAMVEMGRARGTVPHDHVREIRAFRAAGAKRKDLALMYGVSEPMLTAITKRKCYDYVE